jgi:hypothetical protein
VGGILTLVVGRDGGSRGATHEREPGPTCHIRCCPRSQPNSSRRKEDWEEPALVSYDGSRKNEHFVYSLLHRRNSGASPRATTTTMSTVEHEYENDSRLPYAPSTTTKLEEERERGSGNPGGNWRRITNEKTGHLLGGSTKNPAPRVGNRVQFVSPSLSR